MVTLEYVLSGPAQLHSERFGWYWMTDVQYEPIVIKTPVAFMRLAGVVNWKESDKIIQVQIGIAPAMYEVC